jgi:hypothetical protein
MDRCRVGSFSNVPTRPPHTRADRTVTRLPIVTADEQSRITPFSDTSAFLITNPLCAVTLSRAAAKPHTAAKAETTGFARASCRAFDSQPRGPSRSAVWCPARRRCALATRFQRCSVQRPSVSTKSAVAPAASWQSPPRMPRGLPCPRLWFTRTLISTWRLSSRS